jgi:hypothetical protein
MRGPAQAVLWELWRLSRWEILTRIAILLLPCAFMCAAVSNLLPTGRALEPEFMTLVIFMLMAGMSPISGMWLSSLEARQSAFPLHLGFARPIRTFWLVALPMTYVACMSAGCYLVSAGLMRLLFHLPLPMLPVAALIATASGGLMMAVWSPQGLLAKTACLWVVALSMVCIVGLWVLPPGAFERVAEAPSALLEIFTFSVGHYALLLLLFVAAVGLTIFAVERQRHGDGIELRKLSRALHGVKGRIPAWNWPIHTPGQAQFWFEMRRSGLRVMMLSLEAAAFAFILATALLVVKPSDTQPSPLLALWLCALTFSPVVYLLVGGDWLLGLKRETGVFSVSTFDVSQAMSTGRTMATKVLVLIATASLSSLVMACTAAIWIALFGSPRQLITLAHALLTAVAHVPATWWPFAAAGVYVLAVSYVSISAMLLTAGLWCPLHLRLMGTTCFVLTGYYGLTIWASAHDWSVAPLWEAPAWVFAIAIPIGTAWALKRALTQRYITKSFFTAALGLWLIYVAAVAVLYIGAIAPNLPAEVTVPTSSFALGVSSLAIPLASVALAPLALACHRHQ